MASSGLCTAVLYCNPSDSISASVPLITALRTFFEREGSQKRGRGPGACGAFGNPTNQGKCPHCSACLRGFCPGLPSLFLPVGAGRSGVAVPHAPVEGVADLLLCYPWRGSERNRVTRRRASHHANANPPLAILPRHGYCMPWHDVGRPAPLSVPCVPSRAWTDVSPSSRWR